MKANTKYRNRWKMYCSNNNSLRHKTSRRAFTLIEVVATLLILTAISTSVLVVMDQCIAATMDMELMTQAFEIARENMERLLAEPTVSEMTEFGYDEMNPDLEWELIVEPFYEPIKNKMWVQAISAVSFTDSKGEFQTVELTHWLTDLSDSQIALIDKQNELEQEFADLIRDNDSRMEIQVAIREYLKDAGLDIADYDRLLNEQRKLKEQWVKEHDPFDPDAFREYVDSLLPEEVQWLADSGFNEPDFVKWFEENEEKVKEKVEQALDSPPGELFRPRPSAGQDPGSDSSDRPMTNDELWKALQALIDSQ